MKRKCAIFILSLLTFFIGIAPVRAASVTVNPGVLRQKIDGFGAAGEYSANQLHNLAEPARSEILDLLFSQTGGIGLSMFRAVIWPELHPSANTWNWSVNDNQVWMWTEAKKRGTQFFYAVPWSPPAWMKDNNNTSGGHLQRQYYQTYADHFSTYVRTMKSQYGVDVYAVSVQNEPDSTPSWDSCAWSDTDMRDFVGSYLGPAFKRDGVSAKIIPGEPSQWWGDGIAGASLSDPVAKQYVDIVAGHTYGGDYSLKAGLAQSQNKRSWQTESSAWFGGEGIDRALGQAVVMHKMLIGAEINAWVHWWSFIDLSADGGMGEALISGLPNSSYRVNKWLFTLGNFSRFIRPGYYRVEATANPDSEVYVSAYKDPSSGRVVMVAINNTSADRPENFSVSGVGSGAVAVYTTSADKDLVQGTSLSLINGNFSAALPAKSLTTFMIGEGTPTPSPVIDITDLRLAIKNFFNVFDVNFIMANFGR